MSSEKRIIVTDDNYEDLLKELEELIVGDDPDKADRIEKLAEALEDYERVAFPDKYPIYELPPGP